MAIRKTSPPKSKKELAKQLGVSRQSLYYQPKLPAKDLKLKADIEAVMTDHKAYGHKRISLTLHINKKRVLRVMKLFNLKPQRRRKKGPEKPKDIGQTQMNIPNLVQGTIIDAPHNVWVSDFTWLPYYGRFVYLATLEDVFTRQVVGWEVSTRHNADLVAQALLNALNTHPAPHIAHSDQGSEYRSQLYLNLLNSSGIKPSMSEKASPWQNGHQESFYSGFKLELGHPECYLTLGELIEAIAHQIHYYNTHRIHTALKCPPVVFAQRIQSKQRFSDQEPKNNATGSPQTAFPDPRRCLIPLAPSRQSNSFPKVEIINHLPLTNPAPRETQRV